MPLRRLDWRLIAFWIATGVVAFENADGFVWSVLHIGYVTELVTHLGYPLYFINIVGTFQLAAAVALLVPRLPVVKEWAYTGAFINYSSALVSHLSVGDGHASLDVVGHHAAFPYCFLGASSARPPHQCR